MSSHLTLGPVTNVSQLHHEVDVCAQPKSSQRSHVDPATSLQWPASGVDIYANLAAHTSRSGERNNVKFSDESLLILQLLWLQSRLMNWVNSLIWLAARDKQTSD